MKQRRSPGIESVDAMHALEQGSGCVGKADRQEQGDEGGTRGERTRQREKERRDECFRGWRRQEPMGWPGSRMR